MRVYGPYIRRDGRKHVILIFTDGSRRTVSYPKFLLEQHGVVFSAGDTVDHIDGDFTNDSLGNLRVISRSANARKQFSDNPHLRAKEQEYTCPECSATFMYKDRRLKDAQIRRGGAGPFCGRRCAGRYNQRKQSQARTN